MSYYSDFHRRRHRRGDYVTGDEPVEALHRVGLVAGTGLLSLWQAVARGFAAYLRYWERRSAVAALRALPVETLRDIGIERGEIPRVVRDIEQGRDPRRHG